MDISTCRKDNEFEILNISHKGILTICKKVQTDIYIVGNISVFVKHAMWHGPCLFFTHIKKTVILTFVLTV